MIQAISPISFQAKAKYETIQRFIGDKGEELTLNIKAASKADRSYNLNVIIHDNDKFVKGAYSSVVGTATPSGFAEFFKDALTEMCKISKFLETYKIKNTDKITDGLIDFFAKAGDEIVI